MCGCVCGCGEMEAGKGERHKGLSQHPVRQGARQSLGPGKELLNKSGVFSERVWGGGEEAGQRPWVGNHGF